MSSSNRPGTPAWRHETWRITMTAGQDQPAAGQPTATPAATSARTGDHQALYGGGGTRRITVRDLSAAKARAENWPMLTAYDPLPPPPFTPPPPPLLPPPAPPPTLP